MARHRDTYETRVCECCGITFEVAKRSTQKLCSVECQHIWQTQNVGEKNPKFRGGYVVCEQCGKPFLVGKYVYESDRHHFCSTDCRKQWYAAVWSQSPEWREESRARAVRILSSNPSITQTKPQVVVNGILDELQISYINEAPMRYYSVDNYLPAERLAIEVMGDYWHCSPIVYPSPINKIQRRSIRRDKAKHTYITHHLGIPILYLWEADIIKRRDACSQLVKLFIERCGKLQNYHSFNYCYGADHTLCVNDSIITPLQEKI